MSSRLVQVTVVPAATVSSAGEKLKLSIFTSEAACGDWAFWPFVPAEIRMAVRARYTIKIRKSFCICVSFLNYSRFCEYHEVQLLQKRPNFLRGKPPIP